MESLIFCLRSSRLRSITLLPSLYLSLWMSIIDFSRATHCTVALYKHIALYNIALFAAVSLLHFLLRLWSTSSILCHHPLPPSPPPFCLSSSSSLSLSQTDGFGDTFQWPINRLFLPSRLPAGFMPHRISNQICRHHRAGADNTVRSWEGRGLQISAYN